MRRQFRIESREDECAQVAKANQSEASQRLHFTEGIVDQFVWQGAGFLLLAKITLCTAPLCGWGRDDRALRAIQSSSFASVRPQIRSGAGCSL